MAIIFTVLLVLTVGAIAAAIMKQRSTANQNPQTPPPQQPQTAQTATGRSWWKLAGKIASILGIVLAVWIIWSVISYISSGPIFQEVESRQMIIVTREWSQVIHVPLGSDVIVGRRENVAYEIRTQTGNTHSFPRDPEKDTRSKCERFAGIKENLSAFQIRVTDPEKESVEMEILLVEGLPCPGGRELPPHPAELKKAEPAPVPREKRPVPQEPPPPPPTKPATQPAGSVRKA